MLGKSVVCAIDAAEYLVKNPKVTVLMIAPLERQAYALFQKTLNYLMAKYPKTVKTGKDRPTQTHIFLKNDSKLYCLPVGTGGLSVRFLTVHRLYVDEASRIAPDVWTAVQPSLLTTGGDSIYLSTPFGKQGEFYKCWINEDDAYKSFTRFSTNSEVVMRERPLAPNWTEEIRTKALLKLEQARTRMSNREYQQEYMGEFVDSLSNLFPAELIKKCMTLQRNPDSHLRASGACYLGVDIASMGDDLSVFVSLERYSRPFDSDDRLRMIDLKITRKTFLRDTFNEIIAFDKFYKYKKVYIDDGGLGVGVFQELLQSPQTAGKVIAINNASRSLDREDKHKKKILKEDLYMNLLRLMEQGKIQLFNDEEVYYSLSSVQYEYNKNQEIRIFGNDTHLCEALIRAAWCMAEKHLNLWVHYR